jgi:hypothetical protein
MYDEKRGERYFSMHTLTGAELTKLIDVKALIGNADADFAHGIERRRILSETVKPVKHEVQTTTKLS